MKWIKIKTVWSTEALINVDKIEDVNEYELNEDEYYNEIKRTGSKQRLNINLVGGKYIIANVTLKQFEKVLSDVKYVDIIDLTNFS